mmetsp:Transcript_11381/g.28269  ORF Transcript_11381/g.28269 Transcript_11381/m.28269 type:complete len:2715 (+) Transcript_11381:1386-9530(+)
MLREGHADVADGRRQVKVGRRLAARDAQGEHLRVGGEAAGEADDLDVRVARGVEHRVGPEGNRDLVVGSGRLRGRGDGRRREVGRRHREGHLAARGLGHARGRDGHVAAGRDEHGVEAGARLRVLGVDEVKLDRRGGTSPGHRLARGQRQDQGTRRVLPGGARVELLDVREVPGEADGAVGSVGADEAGDGDGRHVVAGEVELGLEGNRHHARGAGLLERGLDGLGAEGGRVLDEQGRLVLVGLLSGGERHDLGADVEGRGVGRRRHADRDDGRLLAHEGVGEIKLEVDLGVLGKVGDDLQRQGLLGSVPVRAAAGAVRRDAGKVAAAVRELGGHASRRARDGHGAVGEDHAVQPRHLDDGAGGVLLRRGDLDRRGEGKRDAVIVAGVGGGVLGGAAEVLEDGALDEAGRQHEEGRGRAGHAGDRVAVVVDSVESRHSSHHGTGLHDDAARLDDDLGALLTGLGVRDLEPDLVLLAGVRVNVLGREQDPLLGVVPNRVEVGSLVLVKGARGVALAEDGEGGGGGGGCPHQTRDGDDRGGVGLCEGHRRGKRDRDGVGGAGLGRVLANLLDAELVLLELAANLERVRLEGRRVEDVGGGGTRALVHGHPGDGDARHLDGDGGRALAVGGVADLPGELVLAIVHAVGGQSIVGGKELHAVDVLVPGARLVGRGDARLVAEASRGGSLQGELARSRARAVEARDGDDRVAASAGIGGRGAGNGDVELELDLDGVLRGGVGRALRDLAVQELGLLDGTGDAQIVAHGQLQVLGLAEEALDQQHGHDAHRGLLGVGEREDDLDPRVGGRNVGHEGGAEDTGHGVPLGSLVEVGAGAAATTHEVLLDHGHVPRLGEGVDGGRAGELVGHLDGDRDVAASEERHVELDRDSDRVLLARELGALRHVAEGELRADDVHGPVVVAARGLHRGRHDGDAAGGNAHGAGRVLRVRGVEDGEGDDVASLLDARQAALRRAALGQAAVQVVADADAEGGHANDKLRLGRPLRGGRGRRPRAVRHILSEVGAVGEARLLEAVRLDLEVLAAVALEHVVVDGTVDARDGDGGLDGVGAAVPVLDLLGDGHVRRDGERDRVLRAGVLRRLANVLDDEGGRPHLHGARVRAHGAVDVGGAGREVGDHVEAGPEGIGRNLVGGAGRDHGHRLGQRRVDVNLGGVDAHVDARLGVHGVLDREADGLGGAVAPQRRLDHDEERRLAVDPGALGRPGSQEGLELAGIGARQRNVAGLGRGALEAGKGNDGADLEVRVGRKLDREDVVEAGVGGALLDLLDDEGELLDLHGGEVHGLRAHGPSVGRAHGDVHVHLADDLLHHLVVGRDLDDARVLHRDGVVHMDLDDVGRALGQAVGVRDVEHQVHVGPVPHGVELAGVKAPEDLVAVRGGEVAVVDAHEEAGPLEEVDRHQRVLGDGHVGLERDGDGVEAPGVRRRLADVLDGELGRRLGAARARAALDLEGQGVGHAADLDGPLVHLDGVEAQRLDGAQHVAGGAVAEDHVDAGRRLLAAAVLDLKGDRVVGVLRQRGEVEGQLALHLVPHDAVHRGAVELDDGLHVGLRASQAPQGDPVLGVRAVARHHALLDGDSEGKHERDVVRRRRPGARVDDVRHLDLGGDDLEGAHVGVGVDHLAARDDDAPLAAHVDVAGADAGRLGVLHTQRVADLEREGEVLPGIDLVADVQGERAGGVVPQALVADGAVELGREVGRVVGLGHVLRVHHDVEVRQGNGARGARHGAVEAVEHRDGDHRAVRQVDVGADRDLDRVERAGQVGGLLDVARDEGRRVAPEGLHVAGHRVVDGADVAAARGGGEGRHPREVLVEARDVGRRSVRGVVGQGVGLLDHRLRHGGEARRPDLDAGRGLRLDGVPDVKGDDGAAAEVSNHREHDLLLLGHPPPHGDLAGRLVGAKVVHCGAAQGEVPLQALRAGEGRHGDLHRAVHGRVEHGHVGGERDGERVESAGPRRALADAPRGEHGVLGHQDARALVDRRLGDGARGGGKVRVDLDGGQHGLLHVGVDGGEGKVDPLAGVGGRRHAHLEHAVHLVPLRHGRLVHHGGAVAQVHDALVHRAHGARLLEAVDGEVGLGLHGHVERQPEPEHVVVAGVRGRLVDLLDDPLGAAHKEGRRLHVRGHEDAGELGRVLNLVDGGVVGAGERGADREVPAAAAARLVHDGERHLVHGVRRLVGGEVDDERARGRVEPAVVARDDVGHELGGRHRPHQVADGDLGARRHRDSGVELHGERVGHGVGVRVALPGPGPQRQPLDPEGRVAARRGVKGHLVKAHGRRLDRGGLGGVDAGGVDEDKAEGVERSGLRVASDIDDERARRLVPGARGGKDVSKRVGCDDVGLVGHLRRERRDRHELKVHRGRLAVEEPRDGDLGVGGEIASRDAEGHVGRKRHRDGVVGAGVPVALVDAEGAPVGVVDQPGVVDEVERDEGRLHHLEGVAVAHHRVTIVDVGHRARRVVVAGAVDRLVRAAAGDRDAAVHGLALERHALALGAVEAGRVDARGAHADGGRAQLARGVVEREGEGDRLALGDRVRDPHGQLLGRLVPAALVGLPDAALLEAAAAGAREGEVPRLGGAAVQVGDGDERLLRQRDVGAEHHCDLVGRVGVHGRLRDVPLQEHGRVHLERGEVARDPGADQVARAGVAGGVHGLSPAGEGHLLVDQGHADGHTPRLNHDGGRVLRDDGVGDREGHVVRGVGVDGRGGGERQGRLL